MAHDPEYFDIDADDRALALHEAGHAIVAHGLGAKVLFVQIKMKTGDGLTQLAEQFADNTKSLAVCVAGCTAEHILAQPRLRSTKKGDYRQMRQLLARIPEVKRRAAHKEAYRLAEKKLRASAEAACRVADVLLDRERWDADAVTRVEREELLALLDG